MSATLEQISGYAAFVKPEIAGLSLSPRRVLLSQDADNDGFWTAECPELRGCISQGKNVESALEGIKEAMELWLEPRSKWATTSRRRSGANSCPRHRRKFPMG